MVVVVRLLCKERAFDMYREADWIVTAMVINLGSPSVIMTLLPHARA